MRRRGQQQDVVRAVAEQFSQLVAETLVALVPRRHAVRLVDDHEVPVNLFESGQDLVALRQIERRDDLVPLHPLVDAELVADVAALEDDELLVELLAQFALPLERQVRRVNDQDALDESAELEFAKQEPRHDRLAGARVVGEQEPHARQLEKVVVDGLRLVRQRIDPGDRQAEVGVELVGDAFAEQRTGQNLSFADGGLGLQCVERSCLRDFGAASNEVRLLLKNDGRR